MKRPWEDSEDNTKMDIKGIVWESENCIHVVKDRHEIVDVS
jgi:hypothetical protein